MIPDLSKVRSPCGDVEPTPIIPAKYAFPVVVAPPEIVSPVVAVPPPIVEDENTPIPTVVDGESRDPLYDQFEAPPLPPPSTPSQRSELPVSWIQRAFALVFSPPPKRLIDVETARLVAVAYVKLEDAAVMLLSVYMSPATVRTRDGVEEPIPTLPSLKMVKSEDDALFTKLVRRVDAELSVPQTVSLFA